MDFWNMVKTAFKNAYLNGFKKKLILIGQKEVFEEKRKQKC